MMHRLFIASITAIVLSICAANASSNIAQIRITTGPPQTAVAPPLVDQVPAGSYFVYDGQVWWLGNGPDGGYYGYPLSGYSPCINGSSNYDIVPSPYLTPATVVVPPLLARPVTPPPMRLRIIRGRWVLEPDPDSRYRAIPLGQYPYFLTAGSAIYNPPLPNFYFIQRIPTPHR